MRMIKEVMRLRYGLKKSQREIKQACRIGKTTVQEYLRRAKAAGACCTGTNGELGLKTYNTCAGVVPDIP